MFHENVRIMEVCGTHTASIAQNGIRALLPKNVRLVSGPGCPVCVTPAGYIDALIEHSLKPGHIAVVFGDMLRVPGSTGATLSSHGNAKHVYSPFAVLKMAESEPGTQFIFGAVGFETTAAVYAGLVEEIVARGIRNVRLLTSIKTMPPAMEYICAREPVDAFICPGHVCAIIGAKPFEEMAERWRKPMAVAGFSGGQVMSAIQTLLSKLGQPACENLYPEIARRGGNEKALSLINKYFEPGGSNWRGIGAIPMSGLFLRQEYNFLDAGGFAGGQAPSGCRCGDVMLGCINPAECPLFGKCAPARPIGACMVSSEGACYVEWGNRCEN